ncbi:MAG: WYL domain-containing protein [Leptolyngbyaceae cyanobacterium bins.59]|nr:WYL domain-containing protein [Leptolyngbyaceae cyanobacterium bins.59]
MGRKGQSVTLSLSEQDKAQLETIAREQGMLWGNRPNLSRLLEAIARRELVVGRNNDWPEPRIRALQQALRSLMDTGQVEEARMIATLLMERQEISIPFRSELERFLETPIAPWRLELDQLIRRQIPFEMTYRDAADRPWTFTIRFARIQFYEKRQYLECWCEETEGNRDIPPLHHNWTLRLDRIPDAALRPTRHKWRNYMDELEVEMHLAEGLAFAYQPRPEDQTVEWATEAVQTRRVVRRITNTFWFFREVLPYGKNCVIVSPQKVREKFKQEVRALFEHYD